MQRTPAAKAGANRKTLTARLEVAPLQGETISDGFWKLPRHLQDLYAAAFGPCNAE